MGIWRIVEAQSSVTQPCVLRENEDYFPSEKLLH